MWPIFYRQVEQRRVAKASFSSDVDVLTRSKIEIVRLFLRTNAAIFVLNSDCNRGELQILRIPPKVCFQGFFCAVFYSGNEIGASPIRNRQTAG